MSLKKVVNSEEIRVQLEAFRGPAGDDYILTEEDKREIAGMVETTGALIDDKNVSANTTYSSEKIEERLAESGVGKDGVGIESINITEV